MSASQTTPNANYGRAGAGASLLPEVLEDVFYRLALGVIVFDAELKVLWRNRQAQLLLADDEDVAVGLARGTSERSQKDWAVDLCTVMRSRHARRFDPVEYRLGSDHPRLLKLTCSPLPSGGNGAARTGYVLVEDVTANKSLENRLAASERYAAVGKLAARVAHELNNPLDGILRYINLAVRTLTPPGHDQPIRYLEESRRGLMRMARIISDLLEYSRSVHTGFEEGTITEFIEDALKAMHDKTSERHIVVVSSFAADMPRIRGASLFQVLCNLFKNAADAMPDGGHLTVTTQLTEHDVMIFVEDTGTGLPEDVQRIFEPFFTTKAPGEGTGLGLAICRDFIEDKYHGTITAENRPEGGARFLIRLPVGAGRGAGSSDTNASEQEDVPAGPATRPGRDDTRRRRL